MSVLAMPRGGVNEPGVQSVKQTPSSVLREPLMTLAATFGFVLAFAVFMRWYQGVWAWTAGLDATLPEFKKYWTSLLLAEVTLIPLGGIVWLWRLVRYKPAEGLTVAEAARREVSHILTLWSILAADAFVAFFLAGFYGEQDNAWHQVVIRDTAFTPSHIPLFYGAFPLLVLFTIGAYLYARTRLPHLYADKNKGMALAWVLMMTGAVVELAWVAVNEWGHSMWIAEEWFAAPEHWGFVAFFYPLAAIFAVWFQTANRLMEVFSARKAAA
ncbi:MAG: hypothetical protein IRY95_09970 [Clostridia bacterium]|nr:hypothetical protein [Clostridia bacterium]